MTSFGSVVYPLPLLFREGPGPRLSFHSAPRVRTARQTTADRAPEVPAFVRPSPTEVRRLQRCRAENRHFVDGDFRKGLLYGGRHADWVRTAADNL